MNTINNNRSNEGPNKRSLQEAVLAEIKAGNTRMTPRWHFVLKAALAAAGFIIVLVMLLYLASFIFFILNKTGVWLLPVFGLRGISAFLASLPWILLVAGFIFLVLLEIMVRHYSFAYRKPLLYSLLGIVVIVTSASIVILQTSFHEGLYVRAHTGSLPIIGQLYSSYEAEQGQGSNVHIGMIREMTEDGFKIESPQGGTVLIAITSQTSFPYGIDFQNGDRIIVLGDWDDNIIHAFGIRRIDNGNIARPLLQNRGWCRPLVPIMSR